MCRQVSAQSNLMNCLHDCLMSCPNIGTVALTFRLKKAVQFMTHEDIPLMEVMYRVGIQTQSYFTKAFKKEFGKTPTQFLQELKK